MSLRIGIDMDGTIADLSSTYHEFEERLFGSRTDSQADDIDLETAEVSDKEKLKAAKTDARRRDAVWRAIRQTENFWTLLRPIEATTVREIYIASVSHDWEVFFVTQRPKTSGASVQAQSQKWLIEHGFETPSVLTLSGSRGKAAHALDLDFLIDDLPKNCIDVISDSRCRPLLVLREPNPIAEQTSKLMHIGVVRSVAEAVELLKQPAETTRGSMVSNVLRSLGLIR